MRTTCWIGLVYLACLLYTAPVDSGSYYKELKTRKVKIGRGKTKNIKYCETKEGLQLFQGSKVLLDDCFVCTCEDELYCRHSYGIMFGAPFGCEYVIDDCKHLMVIKGTSNPRLRCGSRVPVTEDDSHLVRWINGK